MLVSTLDLEQQRDYRTNTTSTTARAKELGCQDCPEYPDQGFLGLKQLSTMQEADKKQRFADMMDERAKNMQNIHGENCTTFKIHLLGQEIYFTSDPKNIQAMLAHKFDDWYLGPARRGNMIATLGDGIFVQVRHRRVEGTLSRVPPSYSLLCLRLG